MALVFPQLLIYFCDIEISSLFLFNNMLNSKNSKLKITIAKYFPQLLICFSLQNPSLRCPIALSIIFL